MVNVVDSSNNALPSCHPAVSRKLIKQGKAVILQRTPFTIMVIQDEAERNNISDKICDNGGLPCHRE